MLRGRGRAWVVPDAPPPCRSPTPRPRRPAPEPSSPGRRAEPGPQPVSERRRRRRRRRRRWRPRELPRLSRLRPRLPGPGRPQSSPPGPAPRRVHEVDATLLHLEGRTYGRGRCAGCGAWAGLAGGWGAAAPGSGERARAGVGLGRAAAVPRGCCLQPGRAPVCSAGDELVRPSPQAPPCIGPPNPDPVGGLTYRRPRAPSSPLFHHQRPPPRRHPQTLAPRRNPLSSSWLSNPAWEEGGAATAGL